MFQRVCVTEDINNPTEKRAARSLWTEPGSAASPQRRCDITAQREGGGEVNLNIKIKVVLYTHPPP